MGAPPLIVVGLLRARRRQRGRRIAQIPTGTVKPAGDRAFDVAHNVSVRVGHGQDNRGRRLIGFGAQFVRSGIRQSLPRFLGLVLGFDPPLLFCFQSVFQVVGEPRAERRIRRREKWFPLPALARAAQVERRQKQQSIRNAKKDSGLVEHFRRNFAQRAVVVEDVEAAAKCGQNQIVHLRLDGQVADRDSRQAAAQARPFLSAIIAEVESEFRPRKEQAGIHGIFGDGDDGAIRGEIALDLRPSVPRVRALEQIRLEVRHFVIVERGIDGIRVVLRCDNTAHVGPVGHAGERFHFAPMRAGVFGDINQAVVGAHVNQPLLLGRFGQRRSIAVKRR